MIYKHIRVETDIGYQLHPCQESALSPWKNIPLTNVHHICWFDVYGQRRTQNGSLYDSPVSTPKARARCWHYANRPSLGKSQWPRLRMYDWSTTQYHHSTSFNINIIKRRLPLLVIVTDPQFLSSIVAHWSCCASCAFGLAEVGAQSTGGVPDGPR